MWNLTATIPFVVLDLWSLFCNSPSRVRANSRCGAINRAYPFGSGQSAVLAGCVCPNAKKLLQTIAPRQSHKSIGVDLNLHPHADLSRSGDLHRLGLVVKGESSSCRGGRCLRNRGYRLGICSDRGYYRCSYLDLGKSEYFRITTDLSTTRKNRAPWPKRLGANCLRWRK
jgi:hypothetical protein